MPVVLKGVTPLLQVFDMPRSIAFYRDRLGFEVIAHSGGENDDHGWAMLRRDDAVIMLNTAFDTGERPAAENPVRAHWHEDASLYFHCPDVDAAYEELLAKGVTPEPPAVARYGMKQMYLRDPDGFILCYQWEA